MQSIQYNPITISQTINCFTRLKRWANAILSRECNVEQDPYNKTPEWLAINPRGLVPTIVHNGKSRAQGLEYADEV